MSGIKPVMAAGGVVYRSSSNRPPQVLLIFRNGVWDLPKGKVEDETVRECAVREVAEEIGISSLPKIIHSLTDTYHEYEQNDIRYGKTTYWFSMQLPEVIDTGFDPQTEEGIEKMEWVSLSEAQKRVGYKNLTKVLMSFEQLNNEE